MSNELVMPSNHLILCHPLLLPSIFPSIRVFSNELALCMKWPKYRSFSFNISPSNEYSGLISFRMDWLDLLAVQGTLKSLLQHHSSKNSNSLALSFLYSPTLTSIQDYWKNHCLDETDLYWQSDAKVVGPKIKCSWQISKGPYLKQTQQSVFQWHIKKTRGPESGDSLWH